MFQPAPKEGIVWTSCQIEDEMVCLDPDGKLMSHHRTTQLFDRWINKMMTKKRLPAIKASDLV